MSPTSFSFTSVWMSYTMKMLNRGTYALTHRHRLYNDIDPNVHRNEIEQVAEDEADSRHANRHGVGHPAVQGVLHRDGVDSQCERVYDGDDETADHDAMIHEVDATGSQQRFEHGLSVTHIGLKYKAS